MDRLLASPHYGEQWGRHWLDVVRFAESDGYEYDMHRPDAWRYRDYVVQSFNDDKPYDAFVKEQLAGDEIDREQHRPASRERLQSPRSAAQERGQSGCRQFAQRSAHRDDQHRRRGVPRRHGRLRALPRSQVRPLPPVRLLPPAGALRADAAERPGAGQQGRAGRMEGQGRRRSQQEMRRLQMQLRRAPDGEKAKLEMQTRGARRQDAGAARLHLQRHRRPQKASPIQDPVPWRLSESGGQGRACGRSASCCPRPRRKRRIDTAKPRLKLAEWIADPANPLTARVMVNRVWQYHFGRGMVSTPNDFGRMGTRPSNPELLDWLASRFVEGGWKIKPIHRMILLSSAYRQSSISPIEKVAMEKDSENALLWKFSHRRLEAEEIPRRHAGGFRAPESESGRTELHGRRSIRTWC